MGDRSAAAPLRGIVADNRSDAVRLMSGWLFSPNNPVPHVYWTLLSLGTRVALLERRKGWRAFRTQARRH